MSTTDTANQKIAQQYDDRPYTSNAFFYTSPGHLRAAAHLYGIDAVPVKKARVLELGSAAGGNLLPFVLAYPDAHAIGVDLSSVQIQQGQKIVEDLGIKNLDLRAMSLTDIDKDFGEFDYIIVHGVFSWVPPEVRQAILRICRENLSPKGLAYISYNTYPGWKAGDIVRDAMLLHSHSSTSDEDKLASAKAMLTLLSDGLSAGNPLGPSLRGAVAQLQKHSDYYIAHEYLEAFNSPCYFLEFADAAQQAGLTHVGDSEPYLEMSTSFGSNVRLHHSLIAMGQTRIMRQQYLDFAMGRNFRKSMLVSQEREAEIAISPLLERLRDFRWAGFFTPAETPADAQPNTRSYTSHKGSALNTADDKVVAVVQLLSTAWPASVPFKELVLQLETLGTIEGDIESAVEAVLETLFKSNMLRFTLDQLPYDVNHGEAPALVPGVTYVHNASKDPLFAVGTFSLWHEVANLQLREAEGFILQYIDGSNSLVQLRTRLRDALQQGKVASVNGKMLTGQRNLDAKALEIVGNLLSLLKQRGLLLSSRIF